MCKAINYQFDMERVKATRPVVAQIIKEHTTDPIAEIMNIANLRRRG